MRGTNSGSTLRCHSHSGSRSYNIEHSRTESEYPFEPTAHQSAIHLLQLVSILQSRRIAWPTVSSICSIYLKYIVLPWPTHHPTIFYPSTSPRCGGIHRPLRRLRAGEYGHPPSHRRTQGPTKLRVADRPRAPKASGLAKGPGNPLFALPREVVEFKQEEGYEKAQGSPTGQGEDWGQGLP